MNIIDLDILRPESAIIKLNKKEIDVSFIPCGITFEIDELVKKLREIPIKSIEKNTGDAKKAYELTVDLCATFCSHLYPEMTKEWFRENVDAAQVNVFANCIKAALVASYKGVAEYGKK